MKLSRTQALRSTGACLTILPLMAVKILTQLLTLVPRHLPFLHIPKTSRKLFDLIMTIVSGEYDQKMAEATNSIPADSRNEWPEMLYCKGWLRCSDRYI